ncbi:MAG: hypothetical protein C4321_03130 [Chloroflexota bacterium]
MVGADSYRWIGPGSAVASGRDFGETVWVTWRENRDGAYHIYLRRSVDGGATWLPEQELTHTNTGDPKVRAGENGGGVACAARTGQDHGAAVDRWPCHLR